MIFSINFHNFQEIMFIFSVITCRPSHRMHFLYSCLKIISIISFKSPIASFSSITFSPSCGGLTRTGTFFTPKSCFSIRRSIIVRSWIESFEICQLDLENWKIYQSVYISVLEWRNKILYLKLVYQET